MLYPNEPVVTTGSLYEDSKNLSTTEVAKLVRAALKDEYPGFNFSVKTDYYSLGSAIRVRVKAVPQGFQINNPERVRFERASPNEYPRMDRYTPEASNLLRGIERLGNTWNRRDIDSMTDYYNVRYSFSASFDTDLERADREAIQ